MIEKKYINFQKYNKNLLEMIHYVLLIQEIIKKDKIILLFKYLIMMEY
jgi:hypothetical protein